MPTTHAHPSPEDLSAFALGQLADESFLAVEAHLADCARCQTRAAAAPDDRLVGLLRAIHTRVRQPFDTDPDVLTHDSTAPPMPPPSRGHTVTFADTLVADAEHAGFPESLVQHDRYRLLRLLGKGGMGVVYEAEHRVMQRSVALKVINRAFTANPAAVDRFRREVRAASKLSHPNVVHAYDAENAGETHFLVMEYVAGTTLARLVAQRGPLPTAEACDYARQAALGLQHAHERGLVHRDVKPENLILAEDGHVKVLDFGLASLAAKGDPEGRLAALPDAGREGLTTTNVVMGTPDYVAPEQADDPRRTDGRADVYSLGCTLYFLLTGRVPYPAETAVRKILAHREWDVPSARQRRPDVPKELDAIVTRLLAKKPEDRPQTAGEVAMALAPFAKRREVKRRPRWPWAVAAGVLLAAALLGWVVVHRIQTDKGEPVIKTESDDRVDRATAVKAVEVFRKQRDDNVCWDLDLSPDGSRLLVAHWHNVFVIDVETGKVVHVLTGSSRARFAPDGKHVLTELIADEKGSVAVYDATTGKLLRQLFSIPVGNTWGFTVCPDGRTLRVQPEGRPAQHWNWQTGKRLIHRDESPWESATFWGSKDVAAFSKKQRERNPNFIMECILPGDREVMARYPLDDKAFVIHDVGTGKVTRTIPLSGVERIGEHYLSPYYGRDRCPRVAVARMNGRIHVLDLVAGKELTQFSPENFQAKLLAFSADGRFVAACAKHEKSDVVVWRLDESPAAKDKR